LVAVPVIGVAVRLIGKLFLAGTPTD
jgi:hypothetical protein